MSHGGWVPAGRRSEDGPLPPRYCLRETREYNYAVRTERNILDSEATLILTRGALDGGTALTAELAGRHARPLFVVDREWSGETVARVWEWIVEKQIRTLDVGGPRESKSPGIYASALDFMRALLARATVGGGSAPRG